MRKDAPAANSGTTTGGTGTGTGGTTTAPDTTTTNKGTTAGTGGTTITSNCPVPWGDYCSTTTPTTTMNTGTTGGGGTTTPAGGGGTTTPVKVPGNPDGSCPSGSHFDVNALGCIRDTTTTGTPDTTTTPATTTGGGTTTTASEPPEELEVPVKPGTVVTCPDGTRSVGSSGNAGQPGTGSTHCLAQKTADGSFILPSVPQSKYAPAAAGSI